MRKTFVAEREERPGAAWLRRFQAGQDEAARWYCGVNLSEPPTALECRTALQRYMPELMLPYDRVCQLVGDDDLAHRILSHYRPSARPHGCSQVIWLGEEGPALVRNYDYPLHIVSDRIELTAWSERRVIAKAQRPWGGCLDGMNDDGLVASLTFGGSGRNGKGFAIILMLRYVLETCHSVPEAIAALCRIPVAQPQNVMLLDRLGDHATLFLGPDREPAVTRFRTCTNHQETVTTISGSALRQRVLDEALDASTTTLRHWWLVSSRLRYIRAMSASPLPTPLSTGRNRDGSTTFGRASAGLRASNALTREHTRTLTANLFNDRFGWKSDEPRLTPRSNTALRKARLQSSLPIAYD